MQKIAEAVSHSEGEPHLSLIASKLAATFTQLQGGLGGAGASEGGGAGPGASRSRSEMESDGDGSGKADPDVIRPLDPQN